VGHVQTFRPMREGSIAPGCPPCGLMLAPLNHGLAVEQRALQRIETQENGYGSRYLRQGTTKRSGSLFRTQLECLASLGAPVSAACSRCLLTGKLRGNDGHGLDDAGAVALADVLDNAIHSDPLLYEDALSGQQSAVNREVYRRLKLRDGRLYASVMPELVPDGQPWLIKSLREFANFLRDSGGFEIW
jgi:hypothetical protein